MVSLNNKFDETGRDGRDAFTVQPLSTCLLQLYQLANDSHHITNCQLRIDPLEAERRWGQGHPQGAHLGSNGRLELLSKTHTMAAITNIALLPKDHSEAMSFPDHVAQPHVLSE